MELCPCASKKHYQECCEPYIIGKKQAETAEIQMRARYTAHTKVDIKFIMNTIHPSRADEHSEKDIKDWAKNTKWDKLEIISTEAGKENDNEGKVEFVAYYWENQSRLRHHELSIFKKEDGKWLFKEAQTPKKPIPVKQKVGRNEPCPCGSGKKYKKCCG